MRNKISPCPSTAELANPESLASRCHVRCARVLATAASSPVPPAAGGTASGIPVSPLPGETLQPVQAQAISPPVAPIPVANQPGQGATGIAGQGLRVGLLGQQSVEQAPTFRGQQQLVGQSAAMGMQRLSSEGISALFSANIQSLLVTFLVSAYLVGYCL